MLKFSSNDGDVVVVEACASTAPELVKTLLRYRVSTGVLHYRRASHGRRTYIMEVISGFERLADRRSPRADASNIWMAWIAEDDMARSRRRRDEAAGRDGCVVCRCDAMSMSSSSSSSSTAQLHPIRAPA